ncbi:MAG TPA: hypothetical protein VH206_04725 [Xanthobacteraceae bacterium]|jgi:hypothetical protein|nr:hypothetical protein [Xanthobacteraceae bacterium]
MRIPIVLPQRWPGGVHFLGATLAAFLAVTAVLVAVAYAVVKTTVHKPRDPFRAGSFEFDLAPGWWCEKSGTEIVCNPPGQAPRPAIAIIALKERGSNDNLQDYEDHVKKPVERTDSAGKHGTSTVLFVRRTQLGHAQWVEALHNGSEIPDYFTYYLATNNSYLGILVTMTVHKDFQKTYVRQLNDMMSTLNLYQR